jgi:hypothetical protein
MHHRFFFEMGAGPSLRIKAMHMADIYQLIPEGYTIDLFLQVLLPQMERVELIYLVI